MKALTAAALLAVGAAQAAVEVAPGATVEIASPGTAELHCGALDVRGALALLGGSVEGAGGVAIAAGASLAVGTGTLEVGGSWSNAGNFGAGTGTVVFADGCSSAPAVLTGANAFHHLVLTSAAGRSFVFPPGAATTVSGSLTLVGTGGAPIQVESSGGGDATIALGPAAWRMQTNAHVAADVRFTGGATPDAPASVVAIPMPGGGQATVSWSAPAISGGSAITGYAVTGSPGGSCTAGPADTSCLVAGLTNGVAYTFIVAASNDSGPGTPSDPSSPVTTQGAQAITFPNPGSQTFGTAPVLSASATSLLSVAFASVTPAVCTVSGSTVTLRASGTCTIEATQPGNPAWAGAAPVQQSFPVQAIAPGAPTGVAAVPGNAQASVHWSEPAANGGGITGYAVQAVQDPARACAVAPPLTQCTVPGLENGRTYTFTVRAISDAGGTGSAPSNPVTPLADAKAFAAESPTGTGSVSVSVAGGGACAFERVQLLPAASTSTPLPQGLELPHGLLDFVLHGCDATAVTVTVAYPSALPQGVRYWKLHGGAWAPFSGAQASPGATTAMLTLYDGGPGDDDGVPTPNGRIVDPGGVGAMAAGGAASIPALSPWALALLALLLGWRGRRRLRSGGRV